VRTLVYPRTWGPYRTVQVTAQPLTADQAADITAALADRHIPIRAAIDGGAVHVWPQRPMSTGDEVTALGAFIAATDARLHWHPFTDDTTWSRS
jgi:hypothetical protein